MKRLIIIGEGPTEQEFCKDVMMPYFSAREIYIQNPTIKKTAGGITSWPALKNQIENHLKQEPDVYVTTLIDYYGIYGNHNFPGWSEGINIFDKFERLNRMEELMQLDISPAINSRFIPYVQLHEFEGLLFNDITVFEKNFKEDEFSNFNELKVTIESFSNPELINDDIKSAPSQRLERLIPGYKKIVYGACLAQEIGLTRMRTKSTRFNEWISKLESI